MKTYTDRETNPFFLLDERHTELYDKAACSDEPDKELFFSSKRDDTNRALEYCDRCPVKRLCVDIVLQKHEGVKPKFTGVAGGKIWIKGVARSVHSQRARINWERTTRALKSRQRSMLSPREKRALVVMGWAAGLAPDKIAWRTRLTVPTITRLAYRTESGLTQTEYNRAQAIGAEMRKK